MINLEDNGVGMTEEKKNCLVELVTDWALKMLWRRLR